MFYFIRSMSEPWATVVAHTNYVKGKITHQGSDYEKIIQACIRLQCKPEINKKVERIFFKQAPWGSAEVSVKKENLLTQPQNGESGRAAAWHSSRARR